VRDGGALVKRLETDRRVREVLTAFDRWATEFPDMPEAIGGFVSVVAGAAFERFTMLAGWPVEALRGVLVALCVNAPDDDLDYMLTAARKERAELEASSLAAYAKREARARTATSSITAGAA
jgi:hypothetical protein